MTTLYTLLQRWRSLWACLVLVSCPVQVLAICAATETSGALGTHPSQRVRSGSPITTTADFKLGCGSVVLALFATPTLKAKITTATSGLTLKNTLNSAITIPYQISPVGGGTFTSGLLILDLNGINAVSLLSNNSATIGIKISMLAGANVPAGTYTDSITVNWTYANICEGIAVGSACVGNVRNLDRDPGGHQRLHHHGAGHPVRFGAPAQRIQHRLTEYFPAVHQGHDLLGGAGHGRPSQWHAAADGQWQQPAAVQHLQAR